jgi:hypothetical protein
MPLLIIFYDLQPESHHLATDNKTEILFPKFSQEAVASILVFEVYQKFQSDPLIQLQQLDVGVQDFEPSLGIVVGCMILQKKIERVGIQMPDV